MSPARSRVKNGPGRFQWIALLTAAAVIMGLTFTLGVLVGRQWSRSVSVAASAESSARKVVPPGKRGGLSGADVESPPAVDQKLTFYQTLTAPLGRGSADASQSAQHSPSQSPAQHSQDVAKVQPIPEPVHVVPPPPPYPYTSRGETIVEKPAAHDAAAQPAQAEIPGLWSVQVAAFKTQAQADGLQKQLKQAGLDAYVTSAVASEGQTNYRVRVGTFKSKAEAQRMAERVRGERSLAAFVTPR
jgi:cell division septation protein DedD